MKAKHAYFICSIAAQLFIISSSFAQTVDENSVLKISPLNIIVDGSLKDWGDSLQYFNAESNTRYALSNDKENLYFAIKIDDRSEAIRVLKSGLTLGIDPKGKKKLAYSITFPLNTQTDASQPRLNREDVGEVTQADRDELVRETITTLRGIKVEGFKDIEGDMITTSNTYGIKTVIAYDEKGNLICEAAVALKLLHLDGPNKAEWAYDVKINGIAHTVENTATASSNAMGGGRGGVGGGRGMGGGGRGMGGRGGMGGAALSANGYNNNGGSLSKSVDFSGKFYLAQAQ